MNNTSYLYDKETGISTYVIEYDGQIFTGLAQCAEADRDMQNELTGVHIAQERAIIKLLQYRRNEIKHRLAALNQLFYSVNCSKRYDPHGYMENMLQHQIDNTQEDLITIKQNLKERQVNLFQYINSKDDFYQHIRKNRGQK